MEKPCNREVVGSNPGTKNYYIKGKETKVAKMAHKKTILNQSRFGECNQSYLNELILSSEISVASDPVAMRLDEVGLLLDVGVLHFLHRAILRGRGSCSASVVAVVASEAKVSAVFVRMVVTQ